MLALCAVIVLVTARRYSLPVDVPYKLEPYRVLLLLILGTLVLAAFHSRAPFLPRFTFGGLLVAYFLVALLSDVGNIDGIRMGRLESDVIGQLMQLLSLVALLAIIRMVLTTRRDIHLLLGVLVICGAIVGFCALLERPLGTNVIHEVFDQLFPLAPNRGVIKEIVRGGGVRAVGSSEHPIALGAEMLMLAPFAVYLARHALWPRVASTRALFWMGCGGLILGGMAASVSRSTIVGLAAVAVAAIILRPRLLPAMLAIALVMLAFLAVISPGIVSDTIDSFSPQGGLTAEQSVGADTRGSGRLADVPLARDIVEAHPVFGLGFSTRVNDPNTSTP